MDDQDSQNEDIMMLTAEIASAYVSNNRVAPNEIAGLISSIHTALGSLDAAPAAAAEPVNMLPAVPIKKSVTPDYIICLEDGKQFKSMKRHLQTKFGMTPDEYRAKWGLPYDYPMVAAAYASKRSELALSLGLGRKKAEPVAEPVAAKPARGRKTANTRAKAA